MGNRAERILVILLRAIAVAASLSGAVVAGGEPDSVARQQYEFGMVFQSQGGACKNVRGTVAVPADWPNQQRVRIVKEDLPPGATVTYKKIEDVGRQMVVHVASVPACLGHRWNRRGRFEGAIDRISKIRLTSCPRFLCRFLRFLHYDRG